MPAVDAFERRARAIRRTLRRYPLLEPVISRIGKLVWRRHLARTARRGGASLALPTRVEIDPQSVYPECDRELLAAIAGGNSLAVEEIETDGVEVAVAVAFDHRGRTHLVSGSDRLQAALAEGLRRVPARVVFRHERWARLATEVRAYARQRGGTAYQPYLHPDLADLRSDQGHERFDTLLAALPIRTGTLVDLGANAGYFSHRFEEAGFDCVAVERSEKEAHFLTALRDACGRHFTVLKGSLTEVELPPRPDVALALNIFHHFLKTEASYQELAAFLGRLNAHYMLFEAHLPDEPQMAAAAHDMAPSEFVEWVRTHGGFTNARELGNADDGRPLFLLTVDR